MRISDWSSDVCSSDLYPAGHDTAQPRPGTGCEAGHRLCRTGRADCGGGTMSAATIRRGGATKRKPRSGGRTLKRRSRIDRLLGALPVRDATLHKFFTWIIMLLLVAAMGGFAWFMGLPAMAPKEFSNLARNAGFEVRKVEVVGIGRMEMGRASWRER